MGLFTSLNLCGSWSLDNSRNLSLQVVFLGQIFPEEYQRAHLTEGIE